MGDMCPWGSLCVLWDVEKMVGYVRTESGRKPEELGECHLPRPLTGLVVIDKKVWSQQRALSLS